MIWNPLLTNTLAYTHTSSCYHWQDYLPYPHLIIFFYHYRLSLGFSHPITFSSLNTIQAIFTFFSVPDSTFIYTSSFYPKCSLQGAIVTQREGSVIPALHPSETTPQPLSCSPQSYSRSLIHPITKLCTPAVCCLLWANRNQQFLHSSGRSKAAQQQGGKEKLVVKIVT